MVINLLSSGNAAVAVVLVVGLFAIVHFLSAILCCITVELAEESFAKSLAKVFTWEQLTMTRLRLLCPLRCTFALILSPFFQLSKFTVQAKRSCLQIRYASTPEDWGKTLISTHKSTIIFTNEQRHAYFSGACTWRLVSLKSTYQTLGTHFRIVKPSAPEIDLDAI